jgi:hypothetical protein
MSAFEKKGWFRLDLPDGWTVDESEEPLTFVSPSGEGALQVTASDPRSLKPGDKVDAPLLLVTFLKQIGVKLGPVATRGYSAGGQDWAEAEWTEETLDTGTIAWRGWIATNHDLFAFITYACPAGQESVDRAGVDAILSGFRLA